MPAKRTESKTSKAPAARKPAIRRKKAAPTEAMAVDYDDIATRAYYIHLEGGNDPLENWLRAEQELVATA
jgi:hypothetical protein